MRPTKSPDRLVQRPARPVVASEVGLRLFAGSALLIAGGTIALAFLTGPAVGWKPLLVLAALLVFAEHRDRLFGDQTSASGSIVVAMAAVVAFSDGPWLAGPMLCSAFAGAYWPHIRNRAWSRVAVNASSMSLAAATSATIFHLVGTGAHEIGVRAAAGGAAAVLAFWIVNSLVLGIAVATIQRRELWDICRSLLVSETELLIFAYGGFLVGFAFANAPMWTAALSLALLLVVLDLLVMGRSTRESYALNLAAPAIEAFAVLATAAWLGLDNARLANPVFLTLVGFGLGAGLVGIRRREEFVLFAGLLAGTAAVVSPGIRGSFFAPLAIALAVCLVPMWRRRTSRSRLSLIGAAGLAAVSATAAIDLLPRGLLISLPGSVLVGAVGGLAALTAWHATLGLTLILKLGPRSVSAVTGVMRDEIALALVTGICGAGSGWIGARWGVAGLAASLVAVLGVAWALIGSPRNVEELGQTSLGDDELADVLRSALLDIPASRLPE
jgi:hypothetical protein